MGKIAETAMSVIICCFLTKEKNFRFLFSFAANKRKFAISVCSKQMVVAVFRSFPFPYIYTYIQQTFSIYSRQTEVADTFSLFPLIYTHIQKTELYLHTYAAVSNGIRKQKPRRFSFICLPFAHHTNRSLWFFHCWWRNKQKLSIWQQTKMD